MKLQRFDIIVLLLAIFLMLIALEAILLNGAPAEDHEVLYQASTLDALSQGKLDGIISVSELKKHGDSGIGTFEDIDGEMVIVDGEIYQARYDGTVLKAGDNVSIPYAQITFFEPDLTITMNDVNYNLSSMQGMINRSLPSYDVYYAVRIEASIPYIKFRSVPPQDYPGGNLTGAVANQTVFEQRNINGTIVGFYSPASARGTGVPGYHLHFISKDKKWGGHVLDLTLDDALVTMDLTPELSLNLPRP
jgi:acetolactate decarboxylase